MRLIELAAPSIGEHEARFSWTVTPSTPLYERCAFRLSYPPAIELDRVSPMLWWRIALMCLQPHWPLLRPCRVVMPVRLPPGEAELWLRLTDAAVASLEDGWGDEPSRTIEIVGSGPVLAAPQAAREHVTAQPSVVSCFSGGRDSTTQAAMLGEIGEQPVLVTVTSPAPWSGEHDTMRRRHVVDEIARRTPFELVEVRSDMRGNWRNDFCAERYGVSVNELTDTFLYLAAAIVVGAARGARLVTMASEAEVQENVRRGGMVVQMQHFMYSAVTQRAISSVLAPYGLQVGSLTSSLQQFQVQRLLSERYAELRDLQYSCWELGPDQAACSRCRECRGIALNLAATDVSPAVAGIDMVELLLANADWRPGDRYVAGGVTGLSRPGQVVARDHEMQALRCLTQTSTERIAMLIDGSHPEPERRRALEIYTRLRDQALAYELDPEPGYRAGYLELLDGTLRESVRAILDEHFTCSPPDSYADKLARTRMLADWITAPLGRAAVRAGELEPPAAPGGHAAVVLSEEELEPLRPLIPGPEPTLVPGGDGRCLRVAETLLDGNELAYLTECVRDNWISSAGPFVGRFEQAFAAAVECRFAVACSSGTAALHLAVAACGIQAGDEVIVPAFTMIATANAVRYVGARPVLVDSDPATWNLDPERLSDKLTRRTRAVIAVHTYGQPAEMDAIREFAQRNGLQVIEDAAEAHGARYCGRAVGSLGDVAAFSLYGNKILTAGEGGVVTTDNEGIADVARELRDHAFSRERHFWHRRVGFNYRITNLQAAVALAQTERIEELVSRRLENARRYRRLLAGIDGLQSPPEVDGGVVWMFGVTVGERFGIDRDELRRRLAARGVETRTFFVPLHLQPTYHRSFVGQRYPAAEALGATGLYLPSGPRLSDDDIAYVADAVRAAAEPVPSPASTSA